MRFVVVLALLLVVVGGGARPRHRRARNRALPRNPPRDRMRVVELATAESRGRRDQGPAVVSAIRRIAATA
jgi:hypothetical protein